MQKISFGAIEGMIDLHCHILPAIDDGAENLAESIEMAKMAVADGTQVLATTSHIFPGMYNNTGAIIDAERVKLQAVLDAQNIPLKLVIGADIQLAPNIVSGLKDGSIPALNHTKYFLFEPPHHIAPPRIDQVVDIYLAEGYVPVVTHPERLRWIDDHYEKFGAWVQKGAWMQITSGAVIGMFGKRAQYWAHRMLDEGKVHIIASDGHNVRRRTPTMAAARDEIAKRLGEEEAWNMVHVRPRLILEDGDPALAPPLLGAPGGFVEPDDRPSAKSNRHESAKPASGAKNFWWPFGKNA